MKKRNAVAQDLALTIKTFIAAGKHYGNGTCTMRAVGDQCGILNLGTVISRPGVSLGTICNVIDAVHAVVNDAKFSEAFAAEISNCFKSPFAK